MLSMAHLSQKKGQFTYFDLQFGHPGWRDSHVLDFGGNIGNLLQDSEIDAKKYWCIDVSPEAIEKGRREVPEAHWIWYDRYNISFHPRGSKTAEVPKLNQKFDYILAYSVFTHIDVGEMKQLLAALGAMLKAGGSLAFTFIDPHYRSWETNYPSPQERYSGNNFEWRLERSGVNRADIAMLLEKVKGSPWFRLCGDEDVYLEDEPILRPERYEGRQYHVFHTQEFMKKEFPAGRIVPPANYEMQHCCILRNGSF